MSVLAWSRDLDGPAPVEIEVAEVIGELLEGILRQVRVVIGHEKVGWQNAALSS